MKRKVALSISAILMVSAMIAAPAPVSAETGVLSPVSYTTTTGGFGGQPVTNLQVQDQSGSQNDPDKYVEFTTPGRKVYTGYRTYSVPGSIPLSSITAIQVNANFLGPSTSTQTWTWKIYNWGASTWVTLGTSSGASWTSWKLFTFNATGTVTRYVNSSRQIRIRLQSNNAVDNARLDYEAITLTYSLPLPPGSCTHFVATAGNDLNPGTLASPWRTVQKAANSAAAGNVVCVRAGTYNEKVTVNVSGTADTYITFQNYPGEAPILDGTGITVPANDNGMVFIGNRSYVVFRGFEIRNYKTSVTDRVPIGIRITGTSHHIEIRDNKIHHIEHNGTAVNGTDAHGIAVHGTSGTTSLDNLVIDGNQLYNLKLGSSEALAINGNVTNWQVTNNIVHDVNNIGIVVIGFEDTAPANDQARDGLIAYNDVYNVNSAGNVAYGSERSAGCIYVDGGTRVTIEYNKAHSCNMGVELASEHSGGATSYVTLRNNFIYNNTDAGLSMGGYDEERGSTKNCVIANNTFYNNASISGAWGSELYVQYDTQDNVIKNNIFYANSNKLYILSWSPVMTNNVMDYNLFFSAGGAGGTWQWKDVTYTTFASYQSATGNDANSLNNLDPLLVNAASGDLHLQAGSPAIDAGQSLLDAGSLDIDGQTRVQGSSIDMGADEKQ